MSIRIINETAHREHMRNHAVNVIGDSEARLSVFAAVYRGKAKVKPQEVIRAQAGLKTLKRVLEVGKQLVREGIIDEAKVDSHIAYKKVEFYANNKNTIISRVKKRSAGKIIIATNPQTGYLEVHVKVVNKTGRPQKITVDDIDSFSKVRHVRRGILRRYPEEEIKNHLTQIIGESGKFQDWGGETNDIYTTRLALKSRRRAAAFALKGNGTNPPLTPKKMGKNGDQIARMFRSPAEIFLIVFDGPIKQSIMEDLETHAENKASAKGKTIYYCVIDGDDLARLFEAYP